MADVIYHPGNSNLSGPGIGISGPGPSNGGTTPNNGSSVIDPGSSGSSGRYEKDEVVLNPNAPVMPGDFMDFSQINQMFEQFLESIGGFGSTAEDYKNVMSEMFDEYKQYNDEMWNRAKEYDEYMSNTAIQRQVEDLKKAGLNPILASHLGGASFNGVSPSYASINPAQAFGSLTGLEGTKYSADSSRASQLEVAKLHTSSSEFIAQFNKMQEAVLQDDQQSFLAGMVELNKSANEYLENIKYRNEAWLKSVGFKNQKDIIEYQTLMNKQFNQWFYSDESNYRKWLEKDASLSFWSRLIPGALSVGAQVFSY